VVHPDTRVPETLEIRARVLDIRSRLLTRLAAEDSFVGQVLTSAHNVDELTIAFHDQLFDYYLKSEDTPPGYYITEIAGMKVGFGSKYQLKKFLLKLKTEVFTGGQIPASNVRVQPIPKIDSPVVRRLGTAEDIFFNKVEHPGGSLEKTATNCGDSWLKIEAVQLVGLELNIPSDPSSQDLRKIYDLVYMDPTVKGVDVSSFDSFISPFVVDFKGNRRINVKQLKLLDGKFLRMLNRHYDMFVSLGKENVRNALAAVKEQDVTRIISDKNSPEDLQAMLGLENDKQVEAPRDPYELVAEETINGEHYQLYKALSPQGIKQLANSGFSTWCVNSISYAQAYFSKVGEKGFWYIFKNGAPLFAIGGSDGISSLFNTSLSMHSVSLHQDDYAILQKWQNVYNYPLVKQIPIAPEQFEAKIREIIDGINSGNIPQSSDWEIMFTYSDRFKDSVDMNTLLKSVLNMRYSISRGDGEKIDKSDLLTFIAKFIHRGAYEKNKDIDQGILAKVQANISSSFNSSLDYLQSVAKGYDDHYAVYRDGFIDTLADEFDFSDADDVEDLESFLKLMVRSRASLTADEKSIILGLINRNPLPFLGLERVISDAGIAIDFLKLKTKVLEILIAKGDWRNLAHYATKWNMLTPEIKAKAIEGLIANGKWYDSADYATKWNMLTPEIRRQLVEHGYSQYAETKTGEHAISARTAHKHSDAPGYKAVVDLAKPKQQPATKFIGETATNWEFCAGELDSNQVLSGKPQGPMI
jgi:hypothetical protein